MPFTLKVKAEDPAVEAKRAAAAKRVLAHFGSCIPPSRLLCFLDDGDPPDLRGARGGANRGLYGPIHDGRPLRDLPEYVTDCIYFDDGISIPFPRIVDDLVYLYGSTCTDEVGLTMTLAHELQHVVQHANARQVWAVNGLVPELPKTIISVLKLQWADIPIEREARIVSKRVSTQFFGEQSVMQYIETKIAEGNTRNDAADVADWQFVRTLTPSETVDLEADTQRLFKRLKHYRPELEAVLQEKKDDPDSGGIDLDVYFDSA